MTQIICLSWLFFYTVFPYSGQCRSKIRLHVLCSLILIYIGHKSNYSRERRFQGLKKKKNKKFKITGPIENGLKSDRLFKEVLGTVHNKILNYMSLDYGSSCIEIPRRLAGIELGIYRSRIYSLNHFDA